MAGIWRRASSKGATETFKDGGESPESAASTESFSCVTKGLADIYENHVLPLEKDFRFSHFYSPSLTEGDFKAKPMVLLIGQYSTGKTTFVKHMLEKEYPGLRIGPEPTTDKFVAVCHSDYLGGDVANGDKSIPPAQVLPGHAAVVDRKLPWSQLEKFGPSFLSRFEVVHVNSAVFKGVTLIDTPGVLAGNKQWGRGYDFEGVIRWFSERVDLVLLFFDAHKLDISDEFRRCIQALKGQESKVCILLNKADSVSSQQLMRVYGALMWSLGKVMTAPEVPRIYIGSFWDKPIQNVESRPLFEQESDDLFRLLYSLPARSAARKIDDFLKRVRLCRTHCLLMNHLRKQMPLIGKTAKHKELVTNIEDIYEQLVREYSLLLSDFPPPEDFREKLQQVTDLHKLPRLEMKRLKDLDETVRSRVAALTRLVPGEEVRLRRVSGSTVKPFGDSCTLSPTVWLKSQDSDRVSADKSISTPLGAFAKAAGASGEMRPGDRPSFVTRHGQWLQNVREEVPPSSPGNEREEGWHVSSGNSSEVDLGPLPERFKIISVDTTDGGVTEAYRLGNEPEQDEGFEIGSP